ncbi:hypothetical protein E2C01_054725 [Portunus trituberculatus]|uniref:Uncharacterized protein n=1 Tax=Portunus trituberculatus TaxID=210409 RepID=A0A5B7GSQ8_PORTR|nr:hypothetical protein [Portunus trituberculatus]
MVEHGTRYSVEDRVIVDRTLVNPAAEVPVIVINFSHHLKKLKEEVVAGLIEAYVEQRSCACKRSLMKPHEELPDHLASSAWTAPSGATKETYSGEGMSSPLEI